MGHYTKAITFTALFPGLQVFCNLFFIIIKHFFVVKLWQPATTTTIDPECEKNEELYSHVLTHPDSVSNSMRRSFLGK